jgi:hypothetical protein
MSVDRNAYPILDIRNAQVRQPPLQTPSLASMPNEFERVLIVSRRR